MLRLCERISRIFIYRECVTEVYEAKRNWRGKSSQLIGQQQQNNSNWFCRFRSRHHWRNLFHFSHGKKNRLLIVQITDQFNFFTERFLSRKNLGKKFVLTSKNFFRKLNSFCRLRKKLSNRSSRVQIPRDICYRFGRYCTLRSGIG